MLSRGAATAFGKHHGYSSVIPGAFFVHQHEHLGIDQMPDASDASRSIGGPQRPNRSHCSRRMV